VLDKTRGSGGGNMPVMLMVLGAIIIFGIGMLAFLSSKGTTEKKTAAEAAKPNLGRVTGTPAPGDLIPSDKVKPSPDEVKKGGTVDAADIEKTKAPKVAQAQDSNKQSPPNGNKPTSLRDWNPWRRPRYMRLWRRWSSTTTSETERC
jgi:hypothetical protein